MHSQRKIKTLIDPFPYAGVINLKKHFQNKKYCHVVLCILCKTVIHRFQNGCVVETEFDLCFSIIIIDELDISSQCSDDHFGTLLQCYIVMCFICCIVILY